MARLRLRVLDSLVLKDRFTLGKPGHAEGDYCEGLQPKYWSKPLNSGFDCRQCDNEHQEDTSKDRVSVHTIDGVSLQLSTRGFFVRSSLCEQRKGEVGKRQEEQRSERQV